MITVSKRRGYDQLQFLKVKNLAVWQAYFHGGSTSSNLVGDGEKLLISFQVVGGKKESA